MVVADCCYKYDEDENVYNNDGDDYQVALLKLKKVAR